MAQYKTGIFNYGSGTGTLAITGVTFQPKLVLFFDTTQAATGVGENNANWMMGYAYDNGATVETASLAFYDQNNGKQAQRYKSSGISTDIRSLANNNGANGNQFTVDSMDVDGFTINKSVTDEVNAQIMYMAFDTTNVHAEWRSAPAGTGNEAITGFGFRPDVLIAMTGSTASDDYNQNGVGHYSYGMSDGTTDVCMGSSGAYDDANTWTSSNLIDNEATPTLRASTSSLDADGCTINWASTSSGIRWILIGIADSDSQFKVGTWTPGSGTGTKTYSGLPFTPQAVITAYTGLAQSGTITTTQCTWNVGSCDGINTTGTLDQNYIHQHQTDGNNAASRKDVNQNDLLYIRRPTAAKEADLVKFTSDGFQTNWTTNADAIGDVMFLAFSLPDRCIYYRDANGNVPQSIKINGVCYSLESTENYRTQKIIDIDSEHTSCYDCENPIPESSPQP